MPCSRMLRGVVVCDTLAAGACSKAEYWEEEDQEGGGGGGDRLHGGGLVSLGVLNVADVY
jgi:hypothetical protein